MKLICKNCKTEFDLRNAEYNRQVKNGRAKDHFFCRQGCAATYNNQLIEYELTEARKQQLEQIKKKPVLSPDDERSFTYCINKCRSKTKSRNMKGRAHEMDIDTTYLKELWFKQDGKCAVSGIKMQLKHHTSKVEYSYNLASLDRVDNARGYIKGNVRFVCLMANYALSTFSDQDLLNFCKSVVEYNNGLSC